VVLKFTHVDRQTQPDLYAFISCTVCTEFIIWETDDILTHGRNNGKKEREEEKPQENNLALCGQGEV
jgi:hypothetical protein